METIKDSVRDQGASGHSKTTITRDRVSTIMAIRVSVNNNSNKFVNNNHHHNNNN